MKYAALLYDNEASGPQPGTEEFGKLIAEYGAFSAKHSDKILGGEALNPSQTATSLQVKNGEVLTTDGPYAETKEVIGGFYLLECKDHDEAVRVAADIPAAKTGIVEVRPIMEIPED